MTRTDRPAADLPDRPAGDATPDAPLMVAESCARFAELYTAFPEAAVDFLRGLSGLLQGPRPAHTLQIMAEAVGRMAEAAHANEGAVCYVLGRAHLIPRNRPHAIHLLLSMLSDPATATGHYGTLGRERGRSKQYGHKIRCAALAELGRVYPEVAGLYQKMRQPQVVAAKAGERICKNVKSKS